VFTTTPTEVQPIDEVIASGPDKLSGGDKREWEHTVESLRQAFVGAVFEQRGDALTLDRTELAEASIYTGAQAVEAGLSAIAVTDHDVIADALTRRTTIRDGLEVIAGVEVRADCLDTKVEILGYFVDPTDETLGRTLERAR
jgi:ClpP class serine protease